MGKSSAVKDGVEEEWSDLNGNKEGNRVRKERNEAVEWLWTISVPNWRKCVEQVKGPEQETLSDSSV